MKPVLKITAGRHRLHTLISHPLYGSDGGTAGGGNIIDDRHPLTRLDISFNPFNDPVVFLSLADGKGFDGFSAQFRGKSSCDGNRIRAKSQTADRAHVFIFYGSNIKLPARNIPRGCNVVGLQLI